MLYDELKKIENEEKVQNKSINDSKEETEEKKSDKFKREYQIQDLNTYNEIATLYRRFKTALDKTKDYTDAGLFYYNELEMKRKYFREKKNYGRWGLYSLYKFFMGYGAKPLLSFIWLILSAFIFSGINLINGIKDCTGRIISYEWALSLPNWTDWLISFQYTISRFLPKTYLPHNWAEIETTGSGLIPFFNSVVLILFLVFTGIGLKRHFRRF